MLQNCGDLKDAWAAVANQAESERLEAEEEREGFHDVRTEPLADDHDYLDGEYEEHNIGGISVNHDKDLCLTRSVKPLLQCMNKRQQVFYIVRQWCLKKSMGLNPEPFRIFLSGAAGVGKSLLIKCIYYEATKILSQHQNQNLDHFSICVPDSNNGPGSFQHRWIYSSLPVEDHQTTERTL